MAAAQGGSSGSCGSRSVASLLVKSPRSREGGEVAQGHTARQWQCPRFLTCWASLLHGAAPCSTFLAGLRVDAVG